MNVKNVIKEVIYQKIKANVYKIQMVLLDAENILQLHFVRNVMGNQIMCQAVVANAKKFNLKYKTATLIMKTTHAKYARRDIELKAVNHA